MIMDVRFPSYNQLCVACPRPDTYQGKKKVNSLNFCKKEKIKDLRNN